MNGRKAAVRCAWLVAVAFVMSSCSSSGADPNRTKEHRGTSGLTIAQATDQVHAYARQTLTALPTGGRLVPEGDDIRLPCSDSDGAPISTPVSVQLAYRLEGVDLADISSVLDKFVTYWKAQGWTVALDQRPKSNYVVVENGKAYEVFLQASVDGTKLSLGAGSPCVPPG